jgi:hypothetical protein
MNLTPADHKLAQDFARAVGLERKPRVSRTCHVKLMGADARLSANDEEPRTFAQLEAEANAEAREILRTYPASPQHSVLEQAGSFGKGE